MADSAAFYDAMWRRYAHLDAASPAAFHRRRLVVDLAAEHAPSAGRIADIGCGQGELLREIEARFPAAKVSGADVSPQSIADTRARAPGSDLFLLDLAAPEWQPGERAAAFDLVICSEVLEHIEDDALAAKRVRDLLAPGGVLVATVPGGAMSRFDVAIGHHRHYDERRLRGLLEGAGFTVLRVLAWGFPFHSAYRTMVRVASKVAIGDERKDTGPSAMSSAMGGAYRLVGRALKPLFYLNLDRWGEQMMAVAIKGSTTGRGAR